MCLRSAAGAFAWFWSFEGVLMAWLRMGIGLFWVGDFVGGFLGDVSFLGAMVFGFPFPFLLFFFLLLGAQGF